MTNDDGIDDTAQATEPAPSDEGAVECSETEGETTPRMVKLKDLLMLDVVPERITDTVNETFVTVRSKCGGAVKRPIKDGKIPVAFTGYRIHAGQLIYSRIDARNNAFAIVPEELDGAVVSKDFPVFRMDEERILPDYLMHFFRTGQLQRVIQQHSKGITNRQRIREDELLAFPVPLPPLDEQRRIVSILDRADAIRTKRRQVLAAYDELPRSLFAEMFGNVTEKVRLVRYVREFVSGKSLVSDELSDNTVLKTSAVAANSFDGNQVKYLPAGYVPKEAHRVKVGDVLINRKNTMQLVGSAGYVWDVSDNVFLPDLLWKADIEESSCNPVFLWQLLISGPVRQRIRDMATGAHSSMVNITKKKMLDLPVKFVPLALQREFAERVAAIEASRRKVERALDLDEELFASLQSRVFRSGI
ncbi:restriction endonuclease subunit S [Bifidobacterium catulorum]|uniref:Restriction endonuclease subunit S n=1 Tax=Bifidobacterium catulorum TaxID=1630173 RepID=A0A2U2MU92_9BIFI|nr:restriction endonuclease subunit S [Bifidobacterium catulorum]PWG60372.1 restriction endonuclease subunit S [Bifidobacterium catulorum]